MRYQGLELKGCGVGKSFLLFFEIVIIQLNAWLKTKALRIPRTLSENLSTI